MEAADVVERARRVKLVLLDVDGVLTDGSIVLHGDGSESKTFYIRDGAAIVWALRSGLPIGLLSARESAPTAQRAAQLGIPIVAQGAINKATEYARIIADAGLVDDEVAYMGDDLLDLPVLSKVGLSAAPADAAPEVLDSVDWVAGEPGGRGAVRALLEMILKAQGRWEPLLLELSS